MGTPLTTGSDLVDTLIDHLHNNLSPEDEAIIKQRLKTDKNCREILGGQRNFKEMNGIKSAEEQKRRFKNFLDRVSEKLERSLETDRLKENN